MIHFFPALALREEYQERAVRQIWGERGEEGNLIGSKELDSLRRKKICSKMRKRSQAMSK